MIYDSKYNPVSFRFQTYDFYICILTKIRILTLVLGFTCFLTVLGYGSEIIKIEFCTFTVKN